MNAGQSPNAPGVAERMARTDAVKKGVDVDAVFQERLSQTANDTEALLDRLLVHLRGAADGPLLSNKAT